jgi:hypothetical protein
MAFSQAARQFSCWILVRRTNKDSLRFIGKAGFVPKPIDCKAKTANNSKHRFAGLVVDPGLVPDAFDPNKLNSVKSTWSEFETVLKTSKRYTVETDKRDDHFGCVKLNGNCIHGDYDLKDVILVNHMHRNLASVEQMHGQRHMRGPLFFKIQQFVNARIGIDMVQHGGEAQYADHSDEPIEMFGPGGEYLLFLNGGAVRSWYQSIGRPTLHSGPASSSSSTSTSSGGRPWTPKVIKGGKA